MPVRLNIGVKCTGNRRVAGHTLVPEPRVNDALSSVFIRVFPATSAASGTELVSALVIVTASGVGGGAQGAEPVDVHGATFVGEEDHFGYAHEITGVAPDGVEVGERLPAVTSPPRLRWLGGKCEGHCRN